MLIPDPTCEDVRAALKLAREKYEAGTVYPEGMWEDTYRAHCRAERKWSEWGFGQTYAMHVLAEHRLAHPGSHHFSPKIVIMQLKDAGWLA